MCSVLQGQGVLDGCLLFREDLVMVRRIYITVLIVIAMVGCMMVLSANEAYAAKDLKLQQTDFDFDAEMNDTGSLYILRDDASTEEIESAVPADKGIVGTEVGDSKDYVYMYVLGEGETTIDVTGSEGTVIPVHVKVGDVALKKALKRHSYVAQISYGDKYVRVESMPGTKVSLKIGKDKYTAFTLKNVDKDCVSKKVKSKKMYNLGTKYTATLTKGSVKVTIKGTVDSNTTAEKASAKKKTFKAKCWNLHKGDTVKLTVGGKSYTKKIKKSYSFKWHTVSFKTKKKIKKNAKFKVGIKNKYKKSLYSISAKLSSYKWTYPYYE